MRSSHLDARYLSQARIHDFIVAVDHNKTITEYLRDFYFKKIQLLQSVVHFEVNITDVVCYFYYVVSISILYEVDGKVIISFVEIRSLMLSPGPDRNRGERDSFLSCSSLHTSRPSQAGEPPPGWPHSGQSSPPPCSPGSPSSSGGR